VTAEARSQGSQFGNGTHRRQPFRRTSSCGGLQKRIYNNLGISGAGLRHNDGAQRYTRAYAVTARQRWLHHVVHEGDFARVGQLAPARITHLNERDYEGRAEDKRKERQIKEILAGCSASEAKVSSTRALVEPENTAIPRVPRLVVKASGEVRLVSCGRSWAVVDHLICPAEMGAK
jgi:hypothetical protein